ncbi:glycosyltransferase family protein [Paraglaciecola sp.]|nr:glycosyltransferase family protein [Paraglaciecola sp.]
MATTNIILQARMSSCRLPEKVLKPILGQPMLVRQIERLQRANLVDEIIIATSDEPTDDAIELLSRDLNLFCFRGNLNNVLDRYYQANQEYPSEHIVRVTGDCPLIEPEIIDSVVQLHITENNDYTSNCDPNTFPDGLDVEVLTQSTLQRIHYCANKRSEREHVTLFIQNNPGLFKQGNLAFSTDYSAYRWTVDEVEDFEFVTKVYEHLYNKKPHFSFQDILNLIEDHPELKEINHQFQRNAGLENSLNLEK